MAYLKSALIAAAAALGSFVLVVLFQLWRVGRILEREMQAQIAAQPSGGVGVVAAGGDVNILPALVAGVAVLVGVFVWRARRV